MSSSASTHPGSRSARFNRRITGTQSAIAERTYALLESENRNKADKTDIVRLLDEKRISVLLELQKKGFLTISHIWQLCYTDKTKPAAEAAMRELMQRGMVDRHRYFMGRGFGYQESFYFLTRKGFNYLKGCELPEFIEEAFRYKDAPMTIANYAHRKALLDFWVGLETGLRGDETFELVSFIPEWLPDDGGERIVLNVASPAHRKRLNVMPDASFVIRNNRKLSEAGFHESLFFVEIDMDTEAIIGKRSLFDRFYKYQLAFSDLAFHQLGPYYEQFDSARLLFVANSEKRAHSVAAKIVVNDALSSAILFTHLGEVKTRGLFASRFLLAGSSGPVDINGKVT